MADAKDPHPLSNEFLLAVLRKIPRDDWLVTGWVLAIKILLFVFAAKSVQILNDTPVQSPYAGIEIWKHWGTLRFLEVARVGYVRDHLLYIYPLYPLLIRGVAFISGHYLISAMLVSTVGLLACAVLLRRLVRLDYSPAVAQRAVWFFLIFPTAYFLQIGYSESLFLALVFGCLLAARQNRWCLAGLLGALAANTRANGIALFPVLAVEAGHQWFTTRRSNRLWIWIALVPLSYCAYLYINARVGGNPLAFMELRWEWFSTSPAWPWVGIRQLLDELHGTPRGAEMVGAQELYFILLGLVCTIISWFKLRPAYAAWTTINWCSFAGLSFIQSAPRYTLALFPVFILFALISRDRFWNAVITVWSLLFLAIFSSLFARGWRAF